MALFVLQQFFVHLEMPKSTGKYIGESASLGHPTVIFSTNYLQVVSAWLFALYCGLFLGKDQKGLLLTLVPK